MGTKGSKFTSAAERAAVSFLVRVDGAGELASRKMSGGVGLFESGVMFGLVDSSGSVFLREDDPNRALFEEAGSTRHGKMPYYSIPDAVTSDDAELIHWARLAVEAAHAAKK